MASGPVLGIDFGTSNSAAALMQADGRVQVMKLDGARDEMPTAVFFSMESRSVLYGSEAMRAYLTGTEGRLLRSLKSLLGSALMAAVMAGLGVIETPQALALVTAVGVVATRVESLIGASLQSRLPWLTNEAVNALQTLVAALLAMGLAQRVPGAL